MPCIKFSIRGNVDRFMKNALRERDFSGKIGKFTYLALILQWMPQYQRAIAQNDRGKIPYHMVGHMPRLEPPTSYAVKKLGKKGSFFAPFLIENTNFSLV